MNVLELVGEMFKIAKERKITQEEIAKYVGRTNVAVSHWKLGRREPSLYSLSVMMEYLGVEIEIVDANREPEENS